MMQLDADYENIYEARCSHHHKTGRIYLTVGLTLQALVVLDLLLSAVCCLLSTSDCQVSSLARIIIEY